MGGLSIVGLEVELMSCSGDGSGGERGALVNCDDTGLGKGTEAACLIYSLPLKQVHLLA
jgi:hypothetical protein